MKPMRVALVVLTLILSAHQSHAVQSGIDQQKRLPDSIPDGSVGVYAMVQKVVFTPNAQAPATIQVWGVFVWVDGGLKTPGPINLPQRGYMYFKLPANATEAAGTKKQWADIQAIAGSAQIIAFGDWRYAGPFEDLYIPVAGGQEEVRVRKQNEVPAKPITYPVKTGLMKIATDSSHAELSNLMKAFLQR
jgi:hypothetical protein